MKLPFSSLIRRLVSSSTNMASVITLKRFEHVLEALCPLLNTLDSLSVTHLSNTACLLSVHSYPTNLSPEIFRDFKRPLLHGSENPLCALFSHSYLMPRFSKASLLGRLGTLFSLERILIPTSSILEVRTRSSCSSLTVATSHMPL